MNNYPFLLGPLPFLNRNFYVYEYINIKDITTEINFNKPEVIYDYDSFIKLPVSKKVFETQCSKEYLKIRELYPNQIYSNVALNYNCMNQIVISKLEEELFKLNNGFFLIINNNRTIDIFFRDGNIVANDKINSLLAVLTTKGIGYITHSSEERNSISYFFKLLYNYFDYKVDNKKALGELFNEYKNSFKNLNDSTPVSSNNF